MSKTKNKEAKFFCENCGAEVPSKAKICPVCGKFFASVRCPKCGKIGSNEDFKNGCPDCGYFVNTNNKNEEQDTVVSGDKISLKNEQRNDSALPVWIYVITGLVLFILIICFYSFL